MPALTSPPHSRLTTKPFFPQCGDFQSLMEAAEERACKISKKMPHCPPPRSLRSCPRPQPEACCYLHAALMPSDPSPQPLECWPGPQMGQRLSAHKPLSWLTPALCPSWAEQPPFLIFSPCIGYLGKIILAIFLMIPLLLSLKTTLLYSNLSS